MRHIKMQFSILTVLFLFAAILSCNNGSTIKSGKLPPPPLPDYQGYCDRLKIRTYRALRSQEVELITGDFPSEIEKKIIFENLLEEKFQMRLFNIIDTEIVWPR